MKSRTRYATLLYTLFLIAENCVSSPLNTSAYLSQIVEEIHAARPLRNSYQIPCSPVFQLLTLALFYNSTNGPNWYRKDGWNSTVWTVPNIISYVSRTCTQKLGTSVISLPAWCCWYGVYCCLSQNSCPNIVMNNGTYAEQLFCGNCTVGNITGLDLSNNNLIGNISWSNVTQEISYPPYHQFLPAIACDMKFLFLQNNQLEETIPQALSDFTALKAVNLGYNQIRGQLPPLQNLDYLQVLAVANNRISGALPTGICAGNNSITDLILGNNLLTGTFDTTGCRLLISVQSQNNKIKGTLPNLTGYGALHILQMANNLITGSIPPGFGKGKLITSLNLASNRLNGTIPADFSLNLQYLNQLSLTNNYLEGTIPKTFFSYLGSLSAAYFDNNFLSGPIPDSIRGAGSLVRLSFANNRLTGTIPPVLVRMMGTPQTILDVRGTSMSCCLYNFNGSRYLSYNKNASLLPPGLNFSSQLGPVADRWADKLNLIGLLSCPYIYNNSTSDLPQNLLRWFLDPSYYMYHGCQCAAGYEGKSFISEEGWPSYSCTPIPASQQSWWERNPWIIVLLSLLFAAILACYIWWWCFGRGQRLEIFQKILDMKKRLKSPAMAEIVTIASLNIEDFEELNQEVPGLMKQALIQFVRNVRKAKWDNFGTSVENSGGMHLVAFHDTSDAVKFCLQVQQLLLLETWPEGLFNDTTSIAAKQILSLKSQNKPRASALHKKHSDAYLAGSCTIIPPQYTTRASASQAMPHERSAAEIGSRGDRSTYRDIRFGGSEMCGTAIEPDVSMLQRSTNTINNGSGAVAVSKTMTESGALQVNIAAAAAAAAATSEDSSASNASSSLNPLKHAPISDSKLVCRVQGLALEAKGIPWSSPLEGSSDPVLNNNHNSQLQSLSYPEEKQKNIPALGGLRVAMGVATSQLPAKTSLSLSAAAFKSKILCTAAHGGQVLICSQTFQYVQHKTEELGSVVHEGSKSYHQKRARSTWRQLLHLGHVNKQVKPEEANLLDMGLYLYMGLPQGGTPHTSSLQIFPSNLVYDRTQKAIRQQQDLMQQAATAAQLSTALTKGFTLSSHKIREPALSGAVPVESAVPVAQHPWMRRQRLGDDATRITDSCNPKLYNSSQLGGEVSLPELSLLDQDAVMRAEEASRSNNRSERRVESQLDTEVIGLHAVASSSSGSIQPSSADHQGLIPKGMHMRVYQVLAPCLRARAGYFGSSLMLYDEESWIQVDKPFFDAPGASHCPFFSMEGVREESSSMSKGAGEKEGIVSQGGRSGDAEEGVVSGGKEGAVGSNARQIHAPEAIGAESYPLVTMVFVMADEGKQYVAKHRRDAELVNAELVSLMLNILLQEEDGYFVKEQDGDLKYMVAFNNPATALSFAMALQECAMYVSWPKSALLQWPTNRDSVTAQLLFRGPRLKIGVCEGQPRSVVADHMGRADYHGSCINQAARFMDVAAHGGQVACEKSLAMRAFTVELQTGPLATAALAATINQSQPVQQHVIFPAQRASVSPFKLPDLRQQQGGTLQVVVNVAASQAGSKPATIAASSNGHSNDLFDIIIHPPSHSHSWHLKQGVLNPETCLRQEGFVGASGLEPGGPPLKVSETGDAAPLAVGEGARGSLKEARGSLKVSETSDAAPLAVGEGARGSLKVPLSVKIEVDEAASQGGAVGPVTVHTSVVSGGELEDSIRSRDLLMYDNLEVEGVTPAKALKSQSFGYLNEWTMAVGPSGTLHGLRQSMSEMTRVRFGDKIDYTRQASILASPSQQGLPTSFHVIRTGLYKFKGSPDLTEMVHLTHASLLERRYPAEPPRGKGSRVAELIGIVGRGTTSSGGYTSVVELYRKLAVPGNE